MKVLITQRCSEQGTTVKVDGWLDAAGAPVLLEVCRGAARPLVVDITDLRDAESEGVAAIQRLMASAATVVGASPYLEILLATRER